MLQNSSYKFIVDREILNNTIHQSIKYLLLKLLCLKFENNE